MFPLKEMMIGGYRFGQKTTYNGFHIGTDYKAKSGDVLRAPFAGNVIATFRESRTPMAGNHIHFKTEINGQAYVMRFLHLNDFKGIGEYSPGDILGHTGNSGKSTGPHLHVDISRNEFDILNHSNFINPEVFNWNAQEEDDMTEDRFVALLFPQALAYWEGHHQGQSPDIRGMEVELRKVFRGELNFTDLLLQWHAGN